MDSPRRVEHQMTDKGYVPVYTTSVVEQPWSDYSAEDHQTWATLFERQMALLPGRACAEFFEGLDGLGMSADQISTISTANCARRPAGP
jgi:phenylalanine-4-hydroxylase